jgi:hypothetical protein
MKYNRLGGTVRPRNSAEMWAVCVGAAVAVCAVMAGLAGIYQQDGGVAGGFCLAFISVGAIGVAWARTFTARSRMRAELDGGDERRRLTDEYRRVADMAITAQEHTDLKLGDVSARIDHMHDQIAAVRKQMESLQTILEEVE